MMKSLLGEYCLDSRFRLAKTDNVAHIDYEELRKIGQVSSVCFRCPQHSLKAPSRRWISDLRYMQKVVTLCAPPRGGIKSAS